MKRKHDHHLVNREGFQKMRSWSISMQILFQHYTHTLLCEGSSLSLAFITPSSQMCQVTQQVLADAVYAMSEQ